MQKRRQSANIRDRRADPLAAAEVEAAARLGRYRARGKLAAISAWQGQLGMASIDDVRGRGSGLNFGKTK